MGTTSNPFLLEEDLLNTTEGFKTFFENDKIPFNWYKLALFHIIPLNKIDEIVKNIIRKKNL